MKPQTLGTGSNEVAHQNPRRLRILLIFMILVWDWAVASLFLLGRASEATLRENFASILAVENMIDYIEHQDSAVLLLGYEEEGQAQFRGNEVEFAGWLGRARDNITIEGEEKVIAAIDSGYRAISPPTRRLRNLYPPVDSRRESITIR